LQMNERIKELAKSVQCDRHWTEEDIEQLGELIVRECVIIDFCKSPAGLTGEQDNNVSKMIKQHFGVN
jgi:hypothetical protein